ncbi:golgi transport protein [Grosmannia clavigera kw1407]|uniref:Golgi transport protein n=1 Tax=Grosmannia clavigera (strain kw1407 / UAMH 11150) TaxID=655863 RepID=F0XTB1_GROCL|nr:golgi transport protein [Grosmannia clavigera kw1407]EFW99368.1 golgi transport protein [Grosmannia clavigera kw1407]
MSTLRDKQIAALKRMLNLNQTDGSDPDQKLGQQQQQLGVVGPDGELVWKVLVFDDLGMQIVSSVLRVSDLRSMGVTMHMHLASTRHQIEDVPVVYLVEPTAQNLKSITSDLEKGLYSPAYINFLSSIPRPLLEEFAAETVANGTQENIAQLYDQYLNFICADRDLFSLGMQKDHTYWALNSAQTNDDELDHVVNKIVSGLFSVVVTMGVIPIIRCPKGMAAEMIATKLDRKLRDHLLSSKDNMFASGGRPASSTGTPVSRPVLIILDRNIDLTTMLSHSWTYQSLVHDVLNMKLNRVSVETPVDEQNPAKGSTKKTYDIAANDFFWNKNAPLPFPQVAEDIDAELSRYKQDTTEITRRTGASSIEDLQNDTSASAQHLKAAITLLPELRERKAVLDIHMNILAALLTGIKDRQLDNFFQIEESIAKQTKAQVLELINDHTKGTNATDKLRLFIIWFLTTEQEVGRTEWAQFDEALKSAGANTTSLGYIRQVRATTKMTQLTTIHNTPQQASASNDLFGRFSSISSRLTDRLKETGMPTNLSANLESIVGSIKNFLPANRDLTVTSIVGSIMDPSTSNSSAMTKTENYLYFDPRNSHARGSIPPPASMVRGGSSNGGGSGSSLSVGAGGGASGGGGSGSGMPGAGGGLGVQGPGTGASFGQRRQGFSDAIVFMVGGGSIDEFGNLQEWVGRTAGGGDRAKRRVVYGATELLNAEEFCREELERLGQETTT